MAPSKLLLAAIFIAAAAGAQEKGGADLFSRRCGGCHAMDRDKAGPSLKGVFGRSAGSGPSFPYSEALKKSGVKWDAATLDRWLADPEKVAPGNDMPFHLENAAERAQIIAWLKENAVK